MPLNNGRILRFVRPQQTSRQIERDGLETFVNHFVFAVKRGVLR